MGAGTSDAGMVMTDAAGENTGDLINPFSEKTEEFSRCLVVAGQKLWVSPELLSRESDVFKVMFFGDFVEKDQESVELPGKTYEEIVEFLHCLIPCPLLKLIDGQNVDLMMRLADEYQIPSLMNACDKYLCRIFKRHNDPVLAFDDLVQRLERVSPYNVPCITELLVVNVAGESFNNLNCLMENENIHHSIRCAISEAKFNQLSTCFTPVESHFQKLVVGYGGQGRCFQCKRCTKIGKHYFSFHNQDYCETCYEELRDSFAVRCKKCETKLGDGGEINCVCSLKIRDT